LKNKIEKSQGEVLLGDTDIDYRNIAKSNVPAKRDSNDDDYEIPQNATIREECVSCGNVDCRRCNPAEFGNEEPERQRFHSPYIYAYWKEGKKLRKRYVGKSWKDFEDSRKARAIHLRPSQYKKFKYIREEADSGNELAKKYLELGQNEEVSIEWAFRIIRDDKREQRVWKMMELAKKSNFQHDGLDQLIEFFASELKKEGLDPTNEQDIDSYLESKIE
jgi:hypothetical protein